MVDKKQFLKPGRWVSWVRFSLKGKGEEDHGKPEGGIGLEAGDAQYRGWNQMRDRRLRNRGSCENQGRLFLPGVLAEARRRRQGQESHPGRDRGLGHRIQRDGSRGRRQREAEDHRGADFHAPQGSRRQQAQELRGQHQDHPPLPAGEPARQRGRGPGVHVRREHRRGETGHGVSRSALGADAEDQLRGSALPAFPGSRGTRFGQHPGPDHRRRDGA